MSPQTENAFSLRRLNPFNGTLQVFTTADARALSSNGVNWEIQVLSETPQGLWANIPFADRQFFSFGIWSRQAGLRRIPLNPLFNTRGMLAAAETLVQRLLPRLEALPFALADRYELWLLDEADGTPVALLNSARSRQEGTQKEVRRWIAAEPGDFRFASPLLTAQGLPTHDGYNPRVHASVLEALVWRRGGQHHRRGWFLRQADGSRQALQQDTENITEFPPLPLTLDWETDEDLALIMDYIDWKAPQLLLLPGLGGGLRAMLERRAVKHAAEIERFWHLYPEIHNKKLLNTARVEAKIRNSNETS